MPSRVVGAILCHSGHAVMPLLMKNDDDVFAAVAGMDGFFCGADCCGSPSPWVANTSVVGLQAGNGRCHRGGASVGPSIQSMSTYVKL